MSNNNDNLQEGLVEYVRNAFEGTIEEENMKAPEKRAYTGESKFVKYKDLQAGDKFTIIAEPTWKEMIKGDGTKILDSNSGDPVVIWDFPVNFNGKDTTIGIYNYKVEPFATSVGTDDSASWIGLKCEMVLEKTKKAYTLNIKSI